MAASKETIDRALEDPDIKALVDLGIGEFVASVKQDVVKVEQCHDEWAARMKLILERGAANDTIDMEFAKVALADIVLASLVMTVIEGDKRG